MTVDITTLEPVQRFSPPIEELPAPQKLKTTSRNLPDGTTNEYVGIYGYGREFAEHYAKLSQIVIDRALWPEDAEPPVALAVSWAWVVIQQLIDDELIPTKVVASAEGGVAVCFVVGDKYADIECLNSGEILGVISNRRDRPSAWKIELNTSDIARATARICQFLRRRET